MCHFMYTYVGRDNKLLHCIVTLSLPAPPGAVPVQTFEQNRYALTSLMVIHKHHSVCDLC